MRKLASVQVVKSVYPIDGADAIECVKINDWQVVVKKGEFSEGDLVVFYEIDAFLPAADHRYKSFEERFINWNGKRGMRLKTIRLRKQISQGLVLSVKNFPEIKNPEEGMDVTELLKIEKWENEPETPTGTRSMGSGKTFPPFIPKTDQERIQNYGKIVEGKLEEEFEVSIKLDGSSMTAFVVQPNSPHYKLAKEWMKGKDKRNVFMKAVDYVKSFFIKDEPIVGFASRNILLRMEDTSNFGKAVAKYDLINKLLSQGSSYALQGEVIAPDIQKNYEKVKEVEFHLFDIFDIDKQQYLLPTNRLLVSHLMGVPHVPVLGYGKLRDIVADSKGNNVVEKCLDYAEGRGYNEGVKREGVVFKSMTSDFSFKAVSQSYLLNKG